MKPEELLSALTDMDDDIIASAWEPKRRPALTRRRLTALLTAAVIASTLITTCLASVDGASWFRRFFADHSGSPLNEGKNAWLSQSTADFQQSKTIDGYTICLESALSDGINTIIQFQVQVPEGIKLDAKNYGITNWKGFQLVSDAGDTLHTSGGWKSYDEDPSDNVFSLMYFSHNDWYEKHIDRIFGTAWNISIEGLYARYEENQFTEDHRFWDETLVTGPWEFQIELPVSGNRELEFISEPVPCPVTVMGSIHLEDADENGHITPNYYQETVEITSLRLRALSCGIRFQRSNGEKGNADFEIFTIVMKDGSQIPFGVNSGNNLLGTVGSGAPGFRSFNFSSPIVLDEVDHILLPDGTQLYPIA